MHYKYRRFPLTSIIEQNRVELNVSQVTSNMFEEVEYMRVWGGGTGQGLDGRDEGDHSQPEVGVRL